MFAKTMCLPSSCEPSPGSTGFLPADHMIAWLCPSAPTVPVEELRARLGTILAWDVDGPGPPETSTTVSEIKDLTREGFGLAEELTRQIATISRYSAAALEASVVLGEAQLRELDRPGLPY
ncbi:hypothetical protein [Streptomyces sp. NBC_01320]|uniref:hypothetical protein n=1 Tax=Streptomyces sp. NBC_01320 TaxID=2903824 RepID=UPI002E10EFDB|nr:hypothetical protein OG395_44280 [Streptomyces sp. NBC_01320]